MEKFKVVIEETVSKEFEVEADCAEAALRLARCRYENGDFVLEPGEVQGRKIAVIRSGSAETEWTEF